MYIYMFYKVLLCTSFQELKHPMWVLGTTCIIFRFISALHKTHNHVSPKYFITPPLKRHIKPADKSVVSNGLYYFWFIVDIFEPNLSAEQSFSAWAARESKLMLDKSQQYSRRRICIYTYNLDFLDRHISGIILYISNKLGAGSE